MTRLLACIYGFVFFNKFLLLSPVYSIFMQSHGVGDMQLSSMFILYSLGALLSQAPVTWLTNRFGAKRITIWGQILKASVFILWLFLPSYPFFAIGMFVWGIQAGCFSVAFEGLMYDEIVARGHGNEYSKILGRRYTVESIGIAMSALGSLLMFVGYDWITWLSVLAMGISLACLIVIRTRREFTPLAPVRYRKLFRVGVKVCRRSPCVLMLMVLSLLVANVPYLEDYTSPIALQIGFPVEFVGALSFILLGCAVIGQTFAYRFAHLRDRTLFALIGIGALGFVGFSVIYSIPAIWMLGLSYMLFKGLNVLFYSRFQAVIPTVYRSIMLSFYTIGTHLVYIAVCLIIGFGSTLGSWRYSILILGMLLMIVCMWAMLFLRNRCPADCDAHVLAAAQPTGAVN